MESEPVGSAAASRRLITTARAAELLGSQISHVDHLARTDPSFPQCVKLGAKFNSAKRWNESEILAWIDARMAARDAQGSRDSKRGSLLAAAQIEAKKRKQAQAA